MSDDDAEDYWNAITVIEAQNSLNFITTSNWAHLSKTERAKLHRQLCKQAYPDSFVEKKALSADNLSRILKGI